MCRFYNGEPGLVFPVIAEEGNEHQDSQSLEESGTLGTCGSFPEVGFQKKYSLYLLEDCWRNGRTEEVLSTFGKGTLDSSIFHVGGGSVAVECQKGGSI